MARQISVSPPPDQTEPFEAKPELTSKALEIFNRNFKFIRGHYLMYIAAISESNKVLDVKGLEFTVFESTIRSLHAITNGYRFGSGVYFPARNVYSFISVESVEDKRAMLEYKTIRTL